MRTLQERALQARCLSLLLASSGWLLSDSRDSQAEWGLRLLPEGCPSAFTLWSLAEA